MLLFIFFVQINYFKPLLGLSITVKRLLYNYLVATLMLSYFHAMNKCWSNLRPAPLFKILACTASKMLCF